MIELHEAPALYEKLIHYNEAKHEKVFLSIKTFREVEYLSIRKYYLDFDEEWKPTKDGVSMVVDFENTRALFDGLVEILSLSEVKGILETHFKETLDELYT